MNELAQILYDNTSDLYKSLGYTLLSEADNDDNFVSSFDGLVDQIAEAIDDQSLVANTANNIKRIFKREYRNQNYKDTPIIDCVDHIMEKLDKKKIKINFRQQWKRLFLRLSMI